MKQILALIMAILAIACGYAQQTTVATLSKASNGDITQYYGITALESAYEAAEDGDAIYLSPGTFNSVTILKNISICGAGMGNIEGDDIVNSSSTILSNSFNIGEKTDTTLCASLQGILCLDKVEIYGCQELQVLRCKFMNCEITTANLVKKSSFINCVFEKEGFYQSGNNAIILNSVVKKSYMANSQTCSWVYENCIIDLENADPSFGSSFKNCILTRSTSRTIDDVTADHCLLYNVSVSSSCVNTSPYYSDSDTIFEEGTYYKLNDISFVGDDGSIIGLYGGFLPFETTPTNPQIVSLKVDSQSTSSGTLPVTIQVK